LESILQFLTMLLTEMPEPNLVRVWIVACATNPKTYFTESVYSEVSEKKK